MQGTTIKASVFRHARDNKPSMAEVAGWGELVEELGTHRIYEGGDKLSQPAISPAEYPEGAARAAANVRRVHFAMLDFDKLTQAQLEEVLDRASGLACLLYTTWSHAERHAADGSWSFRLAMPLSRPVEAPEWPRFFRRLSARFGHLPDPRCKDPSRIYFVPSAPTADGAVVESQDGAPLDVAAVLADAEPEPPKGALLRTVTAADIAALATSLRRRGQAVGKMLSDAAAGKVFAEPGGRDDSMFRMACALAEHWPDVDAASAAAALAPAIEVMRAEAPDCPDVAAFEQKVRRAAERVAEENERLAKERQDAVRSMILDAFGGDRSDPYTDDELRQFADDAGCTRQAFRRRWIVQVNRSFYVYKGGGYVGPLPWDTLVTRAETELAPAVSDGVSVWTARADGAPRLKTIQELMRDYGCAADRATADLTAPRTTYDAGSCVVREAPCPPRDIQPRRVEVVEEWLRLFAGGMLDKLLDWIAAVGWLDQPCAALYMDGAKGVGKSMLAMGLSRLWTVDGPTTLQDTAGDFNDAMSRCPLVFGDECMPEILKKATGTGWLRQFIQARRHPLRRKFLPVATIRGAIRLVLAANNSHMLDTYEALTPNDIAAIAERILYMKAQAEAARFLAGLGLDAWHGMVEGDGIAAHALWLRETRHVDRNRRFIVGGETAELHRALSTGQGMASAVCHWCVGYLLEPGKMDALGTLLVRVSKGRLLVTSRALAAHWDMYPTNTRPPTAKAVQRALSAISHQRKVQMAAGRGRRTNYWSVRVDNLLQWAADNGFCTEDELLEELAVDTHIEGMPDPCEEDEDGAAPF